MKTKIDDRIMNRIRNGEASRDEVRSVAAMLAKHADVSKGEMLAALDKERVDHQTRDSLVNSSFNLIESGLARIQADILKPFDESEVGRRIIAIREEIQYETKRIDYLVREARIQRKAEGAIESEKWVEKRPWRIWKNKGRGLRSGEIVSSPDGEQRIFKDDFGHIHHQEWSDVVGGWLTDGQPIGSEYDTR